jgi:hypothetical protein
MNDELPKVRPAMPGMTVSCSECGAGRFHTQHGEGSVILTHQLGEVLAFESEPGPLITEPIECARCGVKHGDRGRMGPLPPPSELGRF